MEHQRVVGGVTVRFAKGDILKNEHRVLIKRLPTERPWFARGRRLSAKSSRGWQGKQTLE